MNYSSLISYLPATLATNWPVLILVLAWSFLWKGLALWRAAKRGEKWWFAVLLVVNTMGILEILYIYVFARMSRKDGAAV